MNSSAMNFVINIISLTGIILCVISAVAGLVMESLIFGFKAVSLFIIGVGLMVLGCLAKAEQIKRKLKRR